MGIVLYQLQKQTTLNKATNTAWKKNEHSDLDSLP